MVTIVQIPVAEVLLTLRTAYGLPANSEPLLVFETKEHTRPDGSKVNEPALVRVEFRISGKK